MTTSRLIRSAWLLPGLLLLLPACGTQSEATTEQRSAALAAQANGPGKLLLAALDDVPVDAEQRAQVLDLYEDSRLQLASLRGARQQLARKVAAGVRAGAVDSGAVEHDVAAMRAQFDKLQPALIANLNRLHRLLSQTQRKQLVEALRSRIQEHLRARLGSAQGQGSAAAPDPQRRLEHLGRELALSRDQKDDLVADLLAHFPARPGELQERFAAHRQRLKAAARAFIRDDFEAADLALWKDHAQGKKLQRMLRFQRVLLPILTGEQREHIAARIEAHGSGRLH